MSRAVHDQLRGKIDAPLTSLGPQEVKNIPEPVEVWRAEVEGAAPAPAAPKGRDRPSIVVLPFDNMSSDPDQDFLADGIVEDVTTELSRFRWLFVIARNSAFAYKGSPKDVREIARELGVRYVLEGSVRRGGDRLRLTAQLIDAETGGHVAAQRFDRPISDLFELQDDLTAAVVAAVAPEIGAHERALARKKPPESLTAWELYQRALGEYHGYDDGAFAAARALALRAVEADATMAGPCALLARIHGAEIMGGRAPDPEAAMRAARGWAERAVTCDPRSDEAQFALSFIAAIEGRDREALEIQRRGVTLNPNNADVRMHLAVLLMWAGPAHLAAALENAEAAMRLSPADPFLWMFRTVAAMARVRLGDVSAGAALADEVRGYAGLDWKPFLFSALCEAAEGRDDRAKALVAEALERPGSASLAGLDRIFRGGDDLPGFAAASRKLVEFGLPER